MIRTIVLAAMAAGFACHASAQSLTNSNFQEATGAWGDRQGPPGWELRLGDADQLGIVEGVDFSYSGDNAFHFNQVQVGFGGSRLEQCVALSDEAALMLSVWARTDEPHPELAARLRMDFYADEYCQDDSANAAAEQIQSDIGLSSERAPAGQWVNLESGVRLKGELGGDVRSTRISLRLRDRSDDGEPRDPARIVWFDEVSLATDVSLIPQAQRDALRALYFTTDGDQWSDRLNWMGATGTECNWQGVTCNDQGDEVVRLALPRNSLIGVLPDQITALNTLVPGEGLDLCWNDILVPEAAQEFVAQHHLGGDPGFCQGIDPTATNERLSGNFFQPSSRDGEGFMLHMLSAGSALIYWVTYNDQGDPMWLTGSGRASNRVIHFNDLYHTHNQEGTVSVQRVGRASLVFTADEAQPGCRQALMRFYADGDNFAAGDGRELTYLDGLDSCTETPARDPLMIELEGSWYDPAQSGQGVSLMPYADDRLLLNWYTHDEHGAQTWRIGTGTAGSDGAKIEFGQLLGVRGGNFNDLIEPGSLELFSDGSATLDRDDEGWTFHHTDDNEQTVALELTRIIAGPDLLASSGQRIDLAMHPADVDELYTRSVLSDERLPGRVRFNSGADVQDLTGLRFRGNTSRFHPKKSFNIRFEQPQDLLFGSDRMNLNAMYTDPAMMREALSFELFHHLDQPASRTRHFDFWLNGIYEGLHIHIQRVDESLLSMNGLNPDGTLVRDEFRDNADLPSSVFGYHFHGMNQAERLDLLQNNFNYRGDPEWDHLLELVEWVNATPAGASFATGFEQRINQDNFIDWLALHWLIGDIDSFGDDYWLYLDHDDPEARWHFIPWDKDQSFGSHFRPGFFTSNDFFAYEYDLTGGWGNLLIAKFLQTPQLRQRAEARLLELIDEKFTESWLHARIDTLAEVIEDSVNISPSSAAFNRHNQNHHGARGRFHDHVESVRDYVSLRYRFIRSQLAGPGAPIDFAEGSLPAGSTDPLYLTDSSGFTLAIVVPLEEVAVDSQFQIEVQPDSEAEGIDRVWRLEVTGDPGDVELTLFYRNELDSSSWGRGNWYTGGEAPVGKQGLLQMVIDHPDGATENLETRVNPLANKAIAEITPLPGETALWLALPEE